MVAPNSSHPGYAAPPEAEEIWRSLGPQDRKLLRLTALRHKQQQIADALGWSVRTVEDHGRKVARRLPGPGKPREKLMAIYHAGFAGSSTEGRDEKD